MDKDKDKKKAVGPDRLMEVLALVAMVMFIWIVVARIEQFLVYWGQGTFQSIWDAFVSYFLLNIWPIIEIVAIVVGALSAIGIYYNLKKIGSIDKEENTVFGDLAFAKAIGDQKLELLGNEKWKKIQELINSDIESNWRQAIIEADIMLDELLTVSGYHGDSIGEKLKTVEPSDFLTLDSAWEAHKVRNRIAHDGASFELNEREAKQTIARFEAVFKEFGII